MLLGLFERLRAEGVPVSPREHLTLIEALAAGVVSIDVDGFYHLARATTLKDERHADAFDRAFAATFDGLEGVTPEAVLEAMDLPAEWLRDAAERMLTDDERAAVEAAGGFDALMEMLRQRLAEQEGRHEGGSKWIGTGGTSPFGAGGYNPAGVRIGQDRSRHRRAAKVWDRRAFRDYAGDAELNTRTIRVALKRLRAWARDGAAEELDLEATTAATARQGWLDLRTRPERRLAAKVILLLDVGGSMDDHVALVEELFSAARSEFRTLETWYFHNCLYEGVWRDNRRRWDAVTPTAELMAAHGPDWRCVFVGDASMAPWEISHAGGANEHWNPEPGAVWLTRAREAWPLTLWINPVAREDWGRTHSIGMVRALMDDRMVPMTLEGLSEGMRMLTR
jgi:uncharacterized protein with von Willebrand factor type A (vWA) domain